MNAASKAVHIVAPLVAVLVLAAAAGYLWFYVRKQAYESPFASNVLSTTGIATCAGAQPVVDSATGLVTNYTNLLMPDQITCGENVATLNTLCLQTKCTSPACAAGPVKNPSWDAYTAVTHGCVKIANPTCQQQACDADYCNSETVVATLPPLHKFSYSINGQTTCVNPSEADVAALCNAQPGRQWVYPECVTVQATADLTVVVTTSTTRQLTGTISRPFRNDVNDVSLNYVYSLTGISQSIGGALSTAPSASCGTGTNSLCLSFTVYAWPPIAPGPYVLTVSAVPSWSSVLTHTMVAPLNVNVVYVPPPADVYTALNPSPTYQAAKDAAVSSTWLRSRLTETAALQQDVGIIIPATLNLTQLPQESSVPGLFLACKPDIVPLEQNSLMPYKLLLFKWSKPATGLTACTEAIKFDVLRARADGVGATETIMYGNLEPQVLDLVRVGDKWNYTFRAYQGTSYATAACKSEQVTLTVTVTPYTDALCHTVAAPQSSSLPPWMWASPTGCVWNASNQTAADYYCAFEYGKVTPSFDANALSLYSPAANVCAPVKASNPVVDTVWSTKYCPASTESCFAGKEDNTTRIVACNTALALGTTSSTIDNNVAFAERLGNLMEFYDAHNVYPALDASVTPIRTTTDQLNLYASKYFKCGPATAPATWASDPSKCVDPATNVTDAACAAVAASADCMERNVCKPWTYLSGDGRRTLFSQTRTCYVDPAQQTQCCTRGSYTYNKSLPVRGACSS